MTLLVSKGSKNWGNNFEESWRKAPFGHSGFENNEWRSSNPNPRFQGRRSTEEAGQSQIWKWQEDKTDRSLDGAVRQGVARQQWDGEDGGHHGGECRGSKIEVLGEWDPQNELEANGGRNYQKEIHKHTWYAEERKIDIFKSIGGKDIFCTPFLCALLLLFMCKL